MKNFSEFIDESYLLSNHAPLYHYTTLYNFKDIIENNRLSVGQYDNIFKDKKIKMISLTRNKNIDFSYYRDFMDIIIELDTNKLIKNYKIIPYDFFIHSNKETKTKDNIERKQPFEFEEIIFKPILHIDDYILSVNFKNDTIFHVGFKILNLLKQKNITIYENNKPYI